MPAFEELRERARREWESFRFSPLPKILVGAATCGRAAGALETLEAFRRRLQERGIEALIVETGCMGLCYAEPLVVIFHPEMPPVCYGRVTPEIASELVDRYLAGGDPCLELALGSLEEGEEGIFIPELPRFEREKRLILRYCGYIDPENINHYIALGGYEGLAKALKMKPEAVSYTHLTLPTKA